MHGSQTQAQPKNETHLENPICPTDNQTLARQTTKKVRPQIQRPLSWVMLLKQSLQTLLLLE